jgi:hypothetical protein
LAAVVYQVSSSLTEKFLQPNDIKDMLDEELLKYSEELQTLLLKVTKEIHSRVMSRKEDKTL